MLTLGRTVLQHQQAPVSLSVYQQQPTLSVQGLGDGLTSHHHDGAHQEAGVAQSAPSSYHTSDGIHQTAAATITPVSHHRTAVSPHNSGGTNKKAVALSAPISHHRDGAHQLTLVTQTPLSHHTRAEVVAVDKAHTEPDHSTGQTLNPEATSFLIRDPGLVHQGRLHPDLDSDWMQVQQVQAGGVGNQEAGGGDL